MSSAARLVLVLTFALSTQSCCTPRVIEQEHISENCGQRHSSHDSLCLTMLRYDSIRVEHDRSIDRTTDTLRLVERLTEFRYRLVHDTICIARTDTLYRDVEREREVKVKAIEPRARSWLDCLAYGSLLLIAVLITIRILGVFNSKP